MKGNESMPDPHGYFGRFGGAYVAETLIEVVHKLNESYREAMLDTDFQKQLHEELTHFVGRPSPLYHAKRWSLKLGGAQVFLKREDLNHTGAHKINHAIGQGLLARYMGKQRIIAETGAGQHGVATATVAAKLGMECCIYMGKKDVERQAQNVYRMELLGAKVVSVENGTQTLKDAINEALKDWCANPEHTFYMLGTVCGPHPYPEMVRNFQSIVGIEAKQQYQDQRGELPDALIACVGGGSNAMGLFYPFLQNKQVKMYGVEAGGLGIASGEHAARMAEGRVGVLHGSRSYLLSDEYGQIQGSHSISAGMDYPGVGPEHSYLKEIGRVEYHYATDEEVLDAFHKLTRYEGIIPALETSHALAFVSKLVPKMETKQGVIVNLSGRGDKDIDTVAKAHNITL